MGFVEMWRYWQGREALSIIPVLDHASLFAVAGLLIGYYLSYTWGLRRRLPPRLPVSLEVLDDLDRAFGAFGQCFDHRMDAAHGFVVGRLDLDVVQPGDSSSGKPAELESSSSMCGIRSATSSTRSMPSIASSACMSSEAAYSLPVTRSLTVGMAIPLVGLSGVDPS